MNIPTFPFVDCLKLRLVFPNLKTVIDFTKTPTIFINTGVPWFTRDTFYKSCKLGNEAALLCVIAQLRNLEEKRSSSVLHCNNILRSIFTICFASNTDLTEFWVIYIVRTGFHIIWFDSDANLVVRLISETVL